MAGALMRMVAAMALLLSGCASANSLCPAGLSRMRETQLFFGGSLPAAQWQGFVDQEVTPRFPDGFTVLATEGQWRNRDGSISRETGHELLIVFASPAGEAKLNAIRDAYKRRFMQESVLEAMAAVCAGF